MWRLIAVFPFPFYSPGLPVSPLPHLSLVLSVSFMIKLLEGFTSLKHSFPFCVTQQFFCLLMCPSLSRQTLTGVMCWGSTLLFSFQAWVSYWEPCLISIWSPCSRAAGDRPATVTGQRWSYSWPLSGVEDGEVSREVFRKYDESHLRSLTQPINSNGCQQMTFEEERNLQMSDSFILL